VRCPFCPFEDAPRALHAHLGEQHADAVVFEDKGGRSFYSLTCPICGDGYEREIKPRGRDPGFVDEFSAQIRLVALDMLVNHLMGEHEDLEVPADETTEAEPVAPLGDARGSPPVAIQTPAWLTEARRAKQQNGN
jgi:hypothetical protein